MRRLSATTGVPVMTVDGWASRIGLFQISLPVWASKARTEWSATPTNAAQPLGEIGLLTTWGVVRATTPLSAQRTQPVLVSRA